ncbi:MAG TPA: MFS transporter, partial [Chloroflexota bacterium]|nr:MFS transporter [Chloroflexota bacterium]
GAREPVRLGLGANWRQFLLLVVVNAFVGAMVGLERSILSPMAEGEFGLASRTAILFFLVSFGLCKAGANYAAGRLSDRVGRKPILVAGWLFGLPAPLLVVLAPSWSWVVAANVLLGINQGLAWSTTVIMKIDLVGPARRGLAMGLNEAAGYVAAALAALGAGYLAAAYGPRPLPFLVGFGIALAGLALSAGAVRETRGHARFEAAQRDPRPPGASPGAAGGPADKPGSVFWATTVANRDLSSVTQAGMVNNLNDGVAWGLFPLHFAAAGLGIAQVGALAALYPAVWGVSQLVTGWLSDRLGRKWLIAAGMWVQAAGLALTAAGRDVATWAVAAALLGLGTAMVYPTLLAAIGDVAHPTWRAQSVGVYRLWRDAGYAVGAVAAGLLADRLGLTPAIAATAALTAASGTVVAVRMRETRRRARA